MGKLEAIWLKRARGGLMDPVDEAVAVEGRGLKGGADFDSHRQVTLIEREVFDRLKGSLDDSVEPMMRRANLLVSGIRLEDTRGRMLAVGDLRIHIRGETRPCGQMEAAGEGASCLHGRPRSPLGRWGPWERRERRHLRGG